jgi:hypothetical protein
VRRREEGPSRQWRGRQPRTERSASGRTMGENFCISKKAELHRRAQSTRTTARPAHQLRQEEVIWRQSRINHVE